MSLKRVDELPELIRLLHRMRSPERRAAVASQLVSVLQLMMEEATDRRNSAVMRLHASGRTLEQIGQLTGLSRARVHQIVRRSLQSTDVQLGRPGGRRPV